MVAGWRNPAVRKASRMRATLHTSASHSVKERDRALRDQGTSYYSRRSLTRNPCAAALAPRLGSTGCVEAEYNASLCYAPYGAGYGKKVGPFGESIPCDSHRWSPASTGAAGGESSLELPARHLQLARIRALDPQSLLSRFSAICNCLQLVSKRL
jgi:hypothetical protein